MPAYKDEERGTWYAMFYYVDWTGIRHKKSVGLKQCVRQKNMRENF